MDDFILETAARCVIRFDPAAQDMAALTGELIGAAVADGRLPGERQQDALDAVMRREQSAATVMPDGVCFPHARIDRLQGLVVALGIHRRGADLGAPDGQPTRFTVLMLVPADANSSYVQLLGRFSRVMLDPGRRARLLAAASEHEARQILVS